MRRGPARRNLADLVRSAARDAPHRVALVAGERRLTWAALDADVEALATALAGRRLGPGARVALLVGNTPEFVTAYFAVLRAGLVAVPVNTGFTSREVAWQLGDAGASVAFADAATADVLRAVAAELPDLLRVVVGAEPRSDEVPYDDLLAAGRADGPMGADGGGEATAVLLYTSGAGGTPKGAMLSHRALLANLDQCAALDPPPMTSDDVVLLVLPLFHVYGLNTALGMVARTAATGVLTEGFHPDLTLELVRREGVTNLPGAPTVYAAWSERPDLAEALAEVRLLVSGAAPLPVPVLEEIQNATGKPVFEGYGLTEAAPVVATTLASAKVKPGSVGRPVPGMEVRLLDDAGGDAAEGDPGEIAVRGPNLFSGYWPDSSGGPDADGWFATGDVAYADEDGDLFLVDRRKDLVLVSGFNVYPREVEEVVESHPDVVEAAVLAVPHPRTGEAVKVLVVPRERSGLGPPAVVAHCRTRLAAFKCPTIVEMVSDLPHTATGKVAKGALRDRERRVPHRVTLLTRPGCHLCDDARAIVTMVAADVGVPWEEVDITGDPVLLDRYHDDIPVTLVDGEPHAVWRVSEAELRAALATASDGPPTTIGNGPVT